MYQHRPQPNSQRYVNQKLTVDLQVIGACLYTASIHWRSSEHRPQIEHVKTT